MVWIRETCYKFNILRSYKIKTKIISVGNLTFGGTGKTPTVDFLIQNLKQNKKIAVISRGYGRKTKGFFKVNPWVDDAPIIFGDEPVQLAAKHPDVSFYVCEDRVRGCEEIEKEKAFDLIIADDAFQHLRLRRDLDIVVVDASEEIKNYRYPPLGRARNSLSYLKRADYVFLTKTNLSQKQDYEWIKAQLRNCKVIEFESKVDGIYDLHSNDPIANPIREASLVSGIGKPKTFEKILIDQGIAVREHFVYRDHHNYSEADLRKIKGVMQGGTLLTTEKDAVKIRNISKDLKVGVVRLKLVNTNSVGRLYEDIH